MTSSRALIQWIQDAPRVEEGQGLVEYSLIIGLVAVICVAALTVMGGQAAALLSGLGNAL